MTQGFKKLSRKKEIVKQMREMSKSCSVFFTHTFINKMKDEWLHFPSSFLYFKINAHWYVYLCMLFISRIVENDKEKRKLYHKKYEFILLVDNYEQIKGCGLNTV